MRNGRFLLILLAGIINVACSQEGTYVHENAFSAQNQAAYQKYTVEEILRSSEDEELVKISGEIVQQVKGKVYLFRGQTGDIKIVIDDSAIPDKGVLFESPVQIKGEIDNPVDRAPRIEVDTIQYVF